MTQFSLNRREAISAAAFACMSPALLHAADKASTVKPRHQICTFTKPFQHMSYDELADAMKRVGVDGIEAPVRRRGHIEPKDVEKELPKLVEALKKKGLEITLFASSINEVNKENETVLRTAAALGIKQYRLAYFKYDLNKPIDGQLASFRKSLVALAKLNEKIGIQGVYQNHAGRNYVGSSLWDLRELMRDIPPEQLAVAFDIRHATVEGGMSWPVQFNVTRPRLGIVYVKDFVWSGKHPKNVPLGEGRVDPKFGGMLKQAGYTGPVSLHVEYVPRDKRDDKTVEQSISSFAKDCKTLKQWLGQG